MRVELFDFELPEDRIAVRPCEPRDAARLLVVEPGTPHPFTDRQITDLPGLLRPGDCLVFNDTKVIPARLIGMRHRPVATGARIEVTLCDRLDGARWLCLARPAKRLNPGDVIRFGEGGDLEAEVEALGAGGETTLAFSMVGSDFDSAIARIGYMPLPPYIARKRETDDRDREDYQTVYAHVEGAVAAPTAGLHFTARLLEQIEQCGIACEYVTLHVGPGTFLPVKADDTSGHKMHSEWGEVSADVAGRLIAARRQGGRVVAAGTTALRLLETAAAQFGEISPFSGATDIFITPGYEFRATDGLLTNFHLPRSTLFMLVSALCGLEVMKAAYDHAIRHDYRFYSYGDASLLWPQPT